MSGEPIMEAEVVDEPKGAELVRHAPAQAPATLWRTDDPAEVVKRATKLADALAPVIRAKGWAKNLGGDRDHLQVEGWQTVGSMAGVMTVDPWKKELPWPDDDRLTDELRAIRDAGYVFGYEAGYTAQTMAGVPVGGASGVCKRTEANWCRRGDAIVDDYALLGMAQTRAQSRSFAGPLRFVVELAGFSGTPAEEMQPGMASSRGTTPISEKQADFLESLLKKAKVPAEELPTIRAWAMATLTGGRGGSASKTIDLLKGEKAAETVERARAKAKEWQGAQSDVPADTEGLDEPEPVIGDDDESVPF